jgi:hypothetical protein
MRLLKDKKAFSVIFSIDASTSQLEAESNLLQYRGLKPQPVLCYAKPYVMFSEDRFGEDQKPAQEAEPCHV